MRSACDVASTTARSSGTRCTPAGAIRIARVSPPTSSAARLRPPSDRPARLDPLVSEGPLDCRPWARAERPEPRSGTAPRSATGRSLSYWGDLHRHSLISRCTAGDEPELDDFYRYSFDVCEYDFWAVTDHAENTSQYQWWAMQKLADVLHVKGRFVPFYGFEWTAATGHQNVIYESSDRGAPIYSSTAAATSTPDQLWAHLRAAGQRSITIPHHPGSAMVPFDWSYHAEDLQRLVEVFQACRGNYEDDGCFRQYSDGTLTGTFMTDGLRQGHRFGLISSSDHGNGASYVGAFAEELSREAVFAALHDRRTLAATTRDIVVDFRLNDCFMGGVAAPCAAATLEVTARGYRDLARLDVVGQRVRRPHDRAGARPRAGQRGRAGTCRVGDRRGHPYRLERPPRGRRRRDPANALLVAGDHRRQSQPGRLGGGDSELPLPVRSPAGRCRAHLDRGPGRRRSGS